MQYVEGLITLILDSFEEFFNDLLKPTNKYLQECFLVSLVFLAVSVITYGFNLFAFISPLEASINSVMFLIVWLVDGSNRSKVKEQIGKVKEIGMNKLYSSENDKVELEGELKDGSEQ